ncbi:exodeoxyribonuclease V subunit beta [Buchnera aphidicola (Taiwanaphis decaspermi)]|uniref:exodeoxyribonuclease V subunit beta n=1 Tax=Buchnera aphidicola TaxID=9 RepID=UPI0031B87465
MKKLKIFDIPLKGTILIEASAGTGKTFSIIILYIRLLLKINNNYNNIKTKNILILTFTNFAKQEIKKRIKKIIYEVKLACFYKKSNNKEINKIIKKITNFKKAYKTLLQAEYEINECSIYTIHGFCKKLLKSNVLFFKKTIYTKIIKNSKKIYLESVYDYWNKYYTKIPISLSNIILKKFISPDVFFNKILPLIKKKMTEYFNLNIPFKKILKKHKENIKKIKKFKKKFIEMNKILFKIINYSQFNKKIYNKKNILFWFNKILCWSQKKTIDYEIPKELYRFTTFELNKNKKKSYFIHHSLINNIDEICNTIFCIKNILILHAIKKIIKISKIKKKYLGIEFEDLIKIVSDMLKNNNGCYLREKIRKKFPVVFIDECQDIDYTQQKMFLKIYNKKKNTSLILIGDPKQSIYNFRGVNIFDYFKLKKYVNKIYYLNTNWRSSYQIVSSINTIFSKIKNPFIYKNIPYIKSKSPIEKKKYQIKEKDKKLKTFKIWTKKKTSNSISEYQNWSAKICAFQINKCLNKKKNKIYIYKNNIKYKSMSIKDIVILVKNKKESLIIKKQLDYFDIPSCYLSEKKNVFSTKESLDILNLLESIINPTNEKKLLKIMFIKIFNLNIKYFNNLLYRSSLIKEFNEYYKLCKKKGVYFIIDIFINKYIKKNCFSLFKINKKIDKYLHIAEILQKKTCIIPNLYNLIRWFKRKIIDSNNYYKKYCVRKNNINKKINICTIHKSKGLQYPIVWIPFILNYVKKEHFFKKEHKNIDFLKKSQMSEELRLIYVAITRSIWLCNICISFIKKNKQINNDLHNTAFGYLIQKKKIVNEEKFQIILNKINKLKNFKVIRLENCKNKYKINNNIYYKNECKKTHNFLKYNNWQINSYSKIKKNNKYKKNLKKNKLKSNNLISGKNFGIFLHKILKKNNFLEIDDNYIKKEMICFSIKKKYFKFVKLLIKKIHNKKLHKNGLTLSKIKKYEYLKELKFSLYINKEIKSSIINKIIKKYDKISKNTKDISFNIFKGFINGSIDLICKWKEKYYIIDYKSHFLNNYEIKNLKKQMTKNRYDIQYQIYSLVLHKYLKNRLLNYNIKKNLGGVFYLFVRGINIKNSGIFYTKVNEKLIKKLNFLF